MKSQIRLIQPTDVEKITGMSLRFSQNLIKDIKKKYKKPKGLPITTMDLAKYSGYDHWWIIDRLDDKC